MQNTIRLYKTEDFEPITRLWFDAQTVAMPDMMARMDYKFDEAQAYFRNVIVLETQMWVPLHK